jgi:hypothetical protein
MKVFDYYYDYDFGYDFYAVIGNSPGLSLLQLEIHTSEYWSWEPDFRLTFELFSGKLFGIKLSLWSMSLDVDLLNYRYPMDLNHTKE